jgi:hypothetical protein
MLLEKMKLSIYKNDEKSHDFRHGYIIILSDSFMAGFKPITLLIPPLHAFVLQAVSRRHGGNKLNTRLNLQAMCTLGTCVE